jgi:hypothetical protein
VAPGDLNQATNIAPHAAERNREVTIASGAALVRQPLTLKRERKPDALDFHEQTLMNPGIGT